MTGVADDLGMTYRRLGSSGLAVSTVGLGCNNFGSRMDGDRVRDVVAAAVDSGAVSTGRRG